MFRVDISPSQFSFPYDVSLFSSPIQVVSSLSIQILCLESNQHITEVMVGTIYLVSQTRNEVAIHFDNFIVDWITSQLQNFYSQGKVFNYQTLLMLLIITQNMETLQQMDPRYFSDQVDLTERNSTMSFFYFTNRIMAAIYKLIFGSTMLRIQEDFKLLL